MAKDCVTLTGDWRKLRHRFNRLSQFGQRGATHELYELAQEIKEALHETVNSAPSPRNAESTVKKKGRSEEHTFELQSRQYLVCRLLLEKKKINTNKVIASDYLFTLFFIYLCISFIIFSLSIHHFSLRYLLYILFSHIYIHY